MQGCVCLKMLTKMRRKEMYDFRQPDIYYLYPSVRFNQEVDRLL
jgi:hypothetical protein